MTGAFNKLTPAEAERLALLSEECGEVIQVVGKILRHGYAGCYSNGDTNREALEKEIGDVLAIIRMLHAAKDFDSWTVDKWRDDKLKRVQQFLHHQKVP